MSGIILLIILVFAAVLIMVLALRTQRYHTGNAPADEKGKVLAAVFQKAVSLHDRYCIDLYDVAQQDRIAVIVIALEHMISDRKAAAQTSAFAGN